MASDTEKQWLEITRRGLMLVLSSPSGAGKTSISREVLARDNKISLSISATTRPRRPGEVDGEDYVFVDKTTFDLMVNRQELLEHAKVFDHYYAAREPRPETRRSGMDLSRPPQLSGRSWQACRDPCTGTADTAYPQSSGGG